MKTDSLRDYPKLRLLADWAIDELNLTCTDEMRREYVALLSEKNKNGSHLPESPDSENNSQSLKQDKIDGV